MIWAIPELQTGGDSERCPDIGPIGDDLDAFGLEDHWHWRTHRFDLRLNWNLAIDTVELEDFAAMEGVQRGLASGAVDELRLGANEPALSYFREALAEALTPPT